MKKIADVLVEQCRRHGISFKDVHMTWLANASQQASNIGINSNELELYGISKEEYEQTLELIYKDMEIEI